MTNRKKIVFFLYKIRNIESFLLLLTKIKFNDKWLIILQQYRPFGIIKQIFLIRQTPEFDFYLKRVENSFTKL